MANDATKVIVGSPKVGGYAFSAVLGSTLPVNSTTALAAPLLAGGLGYISEDGVQRSVDVSTEDIKDWNGDTVRVIQTEVAVEFTATLMEINENALAAVYGDDAVTVADNLVSVSFDGAALPHKVWIFELADGETTGRLVIGDGQVSNPGGGEITFEKGAPIQHEVVIKCFRDATLDFYHHYQTTPDLTP